MADRSCVFSHVIVQDPPFESNTSCKHQLCSHVESSCASQQFNSNLGACCIGLCVITLFYILVCAISQIVNRYVKVLCLPNNLSETFLADCAVFFHINKENRFGIQLPESLPILDPPDPSILGTVKCRLSSHLKTISTSSSDTLRSL